MTTVRLLLLRLTALAVAVMTASLAAELALRGIYRDAGTRTLGGPGGESFEHSTIDGLRRTRLDLGVKRSDKPRVMVIGDSITYGLGVRDWHDAWTEVLAEQLEQSGRAHEFAIFAEPGQDIVHHAAVMRRWAIRAEPDVFIYQWYSNDVEMDTGRPDLTRPWQRTAWHHVLRQWSYLYFVLDHRLAQLVPPPGRSYREYLQQDFAPGTLGWTEFERHFNEVAVRAQSARRRILLLYPQVPYFTTYPLQSLHERVTALATAARLHVPPTAWVVSGGTLQSDPAAAWGAVLALQAHQRLTIETRPYVFRSGALRLELAGGAPVGSPVIALTAQLLSEDGTVVATASGQLTGGVGERLALVPLTVPGSVPQVLRVRITGVGAAPWRLSDLLLPADYGFEVVDLTSALNQIHTHTSSFDAHPNADAQRAIAAALRPVVTGRAQ